MLGEFRRYTWHVFGGPCEDVPILMEEIDELAFLFAVEVAPTTAYLSGCSGSKGIFFVSLAGLNELSASDSLGWVAFSAVFLPWPRLGPASFFFGYGPCTLRGFLVVSGYGDDPL